MLLHLSRTFLPFFLNIVAALEPLHSAAELWPLYPCFGITMMSNSFGPARTYNSEAHSEVRFKISCSTLSLALIAGGSRAIQKLTANQGLRTWITSEWPTTRQKSCWQRFPLH